MEEIWKPVKNYEDKYLVSNLGQVFSIKSNKILKLHNGSCGYYNVFLYGEKGKKFTKKVHRLVGEAFIINENNKPQINHIDGNKRNNIFSNLEWVTNGENLKHAFKNGLKTIPRGENNPNSKLTDSQIKEIKNLLNLGLKCSRVSLMYNISINVVFRIKRGERKLANGEY